MLDELEICDILSARQGRAEVNYQSGTFINAGERLALAFRV